MTENTDKQPTLETIENLVRNGEILKAVDSAINIFRNAGASRASVEMLESLRQSYSYMINFALTGNPDPGRELLVNDVKEDLLGLIGEFKLDRSLATSSATIPSLRRLDKVQNKSLSSLLSEYEEASEKFRLADLAGSYAEGPARDMERCSRMIFEKVLVLDLADRKDLKLLKTLCLDNNVFFQLKALVIAALYLSFSGFFNRHKFLLLLDILDATDDDKVRARAMTSVFLVLCQWNAMAYRDRRIALRLDQWNDSLLSYTLLREVVKSFLRSLDTARVSEKMRREIMPDLKSLSPDLMNNLRDKIKRGEEIDPEGNPEWEEMLRKSGLEKKMMEFQEMQSEGADLMMLPLSQIKGMHPFFRDLANWFLPFSTSYSELNMLRSLNSPAMDIIFDDMSGMCHTDRFSIALMFDRIPEAQRQMMFSQLQAGREQISAELKERLLKVSSPGFMMELERYMRDLYRFFSLYRKRDDFFNPFSSRTKFLDIRLLSPWLEEPEMKQFLSEFFFKRGYYHEAIRIFNMIIHSEENVDGYVWQKLGYSYQQTGEYHRALEAYAKAEFFLGADSWLIRSRAKCYLHTGEYAEAAELYRQAWEENEDNRRILRNFAVCSFASDKAEMPMPALYKFDYEHPDSVDDLLIIGELLTGKTESAHERIDRFMLTQSQDPENIFKLFGFRFVDAAESGNLPDALAAFESAVRSTDNKEADVRFLTLLSDWGLEDRYADIYMLLREARYARRHRLI